MDLVCMCAIVICMHINVLPLAKEMDLVFYFYALHKGKPSSFFLVVALSHSLHCLAAKMK